MTGLEGLDSIGRSLSFLGNDALVDLTGLEGLSYIGESLNIGFTYYPFCGNALTSLSGLEGLTFIGERLFIDANDSLISLTGLESLTSVGGDIYLRNNASLTSLAGLEGLTSIGDGMKIINNSSLTSFSGLESLTSIEGELRITSNDHLDSLTGLDNIDAVTIEALDISRNGTLSYCEVQSICDYIANPTGDLVIFMNAVGCRDQQEVEEACGSTILNENTLSGLIQLFPNPANQELNISAEGFTIDEVVIYTLTGQHVLHKAKPSGCIDISVLKPGMYIVEAVIGGSKVRRKLVVE
jgi:hypothetical protein